MITLVNKLYPFRTLVEALAAARKKIQGDKMFNVAFGRPMFCETCCHYRPRAGQDYGSCPYSQLMVMETKPACEQYEEKGEMR